MTFVVLLRKLVIHIPESGFYSALCTLTEFRCSRFGFQPLASEKQPNIQIRKDFGEALILLLTEK